MTNLGGEQVLGMRTIFMRAQAHRHFVVSCPLRILRAFHCNSSQFAQLGQIFASQKLSDSDIPRAKHAKVAKFGRDVMSTARVCENLSEPFDRAQGERLNA